MIQNCLKGKIVFIFFAVALLLPLSCGPGFAEESMGKKIGHFGREVADGFKEGIQKTKEAGRHAYQESKEAGKETTKEVKQESKSAWSKAKQSMAKFWRDTKAGFSGDK